MKKKTKKIQKFNNFEIINLKGLNDPKGGIK